MNVTVARVYLSEGEHVHQRVFKLLHEQEQVRGATMFRGIAGFGASGVVHTTGLVDLALDLPVVIEFFDKPERVETVLERVRELVEPLHVLTFAAQLT